MSHFSGADAAVVLLSGGIDSTVALDLTVARKNVHLALSVNYGQNHVKELEAAAAIADYYGVVHEVVTLPMTLPSALTGQGIIPVKHAETVDATFVPGRNLLLISIALARASVCNCDEVVLGCNRDDAAGYPDCRPEFIAFLNAAGRSAYGVKVSAPLINLNKRQIVELGRWSDVPLGLTWSCYRGEQRPCNNCGACLSRREAGLEC